MSIRRYTCNLRGELNPHAQGDIVKYIDHVIEISEMRRYFMTKLNTLNQIMVDAIAASKQGKNESATDYHGN